MRTVDEQERFQPNLGIEPKIMNKIGEDPSAALSVQGEHHLFEESVGIEILMLGQALCYGAKAAGHELLFCI